MSPFDSLDYILLGLGTAVAIIGLVWVFVSAYRSRNDR